MVFPVYPRLDIPAWINQCIYFSTKDNQSLWNPSFVCLNYFNFIMVNYTTHFLTSIASTQLNSFGVFNIDLDVQSKIIALGIRRNPMVYRQSRAGTRIFNSIHSIQNA